MSEQVARSETSTAPKRVLRSGYTTGSCASAAAKAAAEALLTQQPVESIEIGLPAGGRAQFKLHRCEFNGQEATASIIKDAGDDPDVTHRAEIVATVAWHDTPGITLEGGFGVGVVTKPGLELGVGEPAINPVPRQTIRAEVTEALGDVLSTRGVRVIISVPRGEVIAKRTLNSRLGIVGGISILGTTGIVAPFSLSAYTASVAKALGVAVAMGCKQVVLTTGRRSERYAQAFISLPEEAFVQMGDFAGFALEECAQREIEQVTICAMIGKLSKIANGHFQTHVSKSSVDVTFLADVAAECGVEADTVQAISQANTCRHFMEILGEQKATEVFNRLCELAAAQSRKHALTATQKELSIECILIDFDGTVLGRSGLGR